MKKQEIYVSVDIESDGPIPGSNSMLSMGSAAFESSGRLLDTHSVNLATLPNATPNDETMMWWSTQPEAWSVCRKDQQEPVKAMVEYRNWLLKLPGKPVFVGYPAGFDFTFVYWYLMEFAKHSPFSFSAIDIKTFAMARLGTNYRETTKRRMPKRWFSKRPHTHVALDDAIEQGELFCSILNDRN